MIGSEIEKSVELKIHRKGRLNCINRDGVGVGFIQPAATSGNGYFVALSDSQVGIYTGVQPSLYQSLFIIEDFYQRVGINRVLWIKGGDYESEGGKGSWCSGFSIAEGLD